MGCAAFPGACFARPTQTLTEHSVYVPATIPTRSSVTAPKTGSRDEETMAERAAGRGSGTREVTEERREQILQAALEVIVERGYAETRIADVAERAGTSPALVIYYFKTRDQLLTEAIRFSEDSWYETGTKRLESIPTAAGRLTELIAMICLPGTDPEPRSFWLLWLDLWALSPRNPGVAAVRQKSDERWRETIRSIVLAGQEAGEFAPVDADDFTIMLSALLDGLAV